MSDNYQYMGLRRDQDQELMAKRYGLLPFWFRTWWRKVCML